MCWIAFTLTSCDSSFCSDRSWRLSWSRTRGSSRLHPDSSRSTASYWRTTATCRHAAWAWRANWVWSRLRTSNTARGGGWSAAHGPHLLKCFYCGLPLSLKGDSSWSPLPWEKEIFELIQVTLDLVVSLGWWALMANCNLSSHLFVQWIVNYK